RSRPRTATLWVAHLELREHLLHEGDELHLHLRGGELAGFIRPAHTLDLTYGQRAGRADDDLALRPDHGEADRSGGHHRVAASWRLAASDLFRSNSSMAVSSAVFISSFITESSGNATCVP